MVKQLPGIVVASEQGATRDHDVDGHLWVGGVVVEGHYHPFGVVSQEMLGRVQVVAVVGTDGRSAPVVIVPEYTHGESLPGLS